MKPDIHPEYTEATIKCACGATYETRSTKGSYAVDVCAACHAFYTGKQKLMDTAGRVERFRRKYANVKKAAPKAEAPPAEAPPAEAKAEAPVEAKAES